jgi:hypothetical protein
MTMSVLGKVMELSVKACYTPFQELLKFVKMIPKKEEEVAMGMDNCNDLDYYERESLHEEEPLYEEGPLESKVKTLHIASFAASNTIPPQEEKEKEKGGDEEKEEVAMDKADEEE